ncbi:hypothetical protein HAX54_052457 [Datura stramonium]|uniref:Cytochrome P450 n=1 Tax=Datura stramonium TaxID=4076 RepID=A0ABS8SYY9_DATST|nr:hypothetical protein [Datura stramonium]
MEKLVKNPRVQKKDQEELDRVIGSDRIITESDMSKLLYLQSVVKESLRTLMMSLDRVIESDRIITESDMSKLSYLQSVVKESLRLHPPTPLMPPHMASASVKIGGYNIPKGSIVHENVWALGRDPKVWKDPLQFRPERFIEEDVDMKGTNLAINMVTSMLAHLLHHFKYGLHLLELSMRILTCWKDPNCYLHANASPSWSYS